MAETWETDWERELVLPLADPDAADAARVGAKGAALARTAIAGLRVPAGFHVTEKAYRRYVEEAGIGEEILTAVADLGPDEAERAIGELFARHEPGTELSGAIRWAYSDLGDREHEVAVRASGAEEIAGLAFGGRYLARLGVRGDTALLAAVREVWASLWTAQAIVYRQRAGIRHEDAAMAIVVQSMLEPEATGTLFTVAPMSEAPGQMLVNAGRGGSGRREAEQIVVDRSSGKVAARRTSGATVLSARDAAELAQVGMRVEELFERPMVVRWARHEGVPWVLQATPVTSLGDTEVWNDSIASDDVWSNGATGEVLADVMTPCTWSVLRLALQASVPATMVPGFLTFGVIGGRLYQNVSVRNAISRAFGRAGPPAARFDRLAGDTETEPAPLPRRTVLRAVGPVAARSAARGAANRRRLNDFLAGARDRADTVRRRVADAPSERDLIRLWHDDVLPHLLRCGQMEEAVSGQSAGGLPATHRSVAAAVGEEDANLLLTGVAAPDGTPSATLGPIVGLARYARGIVGRDTYRQRWGHRGPEEFELASPRPAEDPEWPGPVSDEARAAVTLLRDRGRERRRAWWRLRERHPGQAARISRRVAKFSRVTYQREAVRSEMVRALWTVRQFVLRAGELTGVGDDVFFLPVDEILAVLDGDRRPLERVAVRRRTYERYRALPPYPTLIKGRFDPFAWAADPDRRTDVYEGPGPAAQDEDGGTLPGFAGSAGVVEGPVRVLAHAEDGDHLRDGEVIVAMVTNIGWSPLFTRASAVITDVGAPLSHMVVAARELGIPAVVGTGDATARLRTGDIVRVDGTRGTVEVLERRVREPERATAR
ncbi:Chondramide synthase cmdD [Actinomadura rubteroloni]|uniref:Chondramide synthase cmdD n=1 Tax=Actinomadura rubteroloni TaxID=1926885 RepID=A0A2P4UKU9_9ACTN|nr:PEP/pyruvate-binding domain-containing protein [Actinomadura rubteroloni]POM25680.1 Chondramide synthase cmdD [Actinomadura rubteroloni]